MGRVRAIIHDAKFPKELWAEVAQTVVYLKNRSPALALDDIMPFDAWYGRKPALDHLRILGCTAYVYVPAEKRIKIDDRAEIGQLVGYGTANNQWKVWILEREVVVIIHLRLPFPVPRDLKDLIEFGLQRGGIHARHEKANVMPVFERVCWFYLGAPTIVTRRDK
jgi:hypothetical protein